MNDPKFIEDVLKIFSDADLCDDLYWTFNKSGKITFYVTCNDLFEYGCADCEEITPDNFPLLKRSFSDAVNTGSKYRGSTLFACRSRGWRPMNSILELYKKDPEYLALLEECGASLVDY